MSLVQSRVLRAGALLAINLLFLMVWGFAGIGKVVDGMPSWFADKFGRTLLASFPGLTGAFWWLTISEIFAFAFAGGALLRGEFLGRRPPLFLCALLVWSLFVFVQLGLVNGSPPITTHHQLLCILRNFIALNICCANHEFGARTETGTAEI
jgi:hypothetical protein